MPNLATRPASSGKSSWLPKSRTKLLALAVATCFAANSHALPTDPVVANGSAAFAKNGSVLNVTNSNGAIINWKSFSIGAGETTRFIQTSASSAVLNRVLANDPSLIYGTLTSNGRVWLVNPAGIMVGASGRIDVAGFVASTLNIRNEDFLAGRALFQSTPGAGSVVNQGSITTPSGGSVYLIGPDVSNEGIITTPQGETILAAGRTVSLLDTATPGVKVDITGAEGNVTNLGSVIAEAGRIGMAGVLVRNSGTLNASSVVSEGGRIFLKASQDAYVDGNGRIVATGSKGGNVEVLGNRVAVTDNASIDVSGTGNVNASGGSIKVGGDYQGKNPDIQNASITYFGPNASLKADAGKVGDGGTVIVWADDTTRAYGNISARGGANGGNGGFVEVSGKQSLVFRGFADRRAPHGRAGTLLLDPAEYTIDGTEWLTIDSNLSGGPVTISTSGASYGGDIEWLSGTYASSYGNTLSLFAYGGGAATGNITTGVGGATTINLSGGLVMRAGWDGASDVVANKGNIALTATTISTNGGDIVLHAGNDVLGGGILDTTASTAGANAGAITVTGNTIVLGSLTGNGASGNWSVAGGKGGDGATITLTGTSITVSDITANGGRGSSYGTGGNGGLITIHGPGPSGSGATMIHAGDILANGGDGSSFGSRGGNGATITLTGTSVTVGNITADGGQGSSRGAGGSGGQITIQGPGASGSGATMIHVGDISANGGAGGSRGGTGSGSGASGGNGGQVSIKATAGSITVGSVAANGGKGGGSANCSGCYFLDGSKGGDGGIIDLHARDTIATGSLSANGGIGGDGAEGGNGGGGGTGGQITLLSDTSTITITGDVSAYGGLGGLGAGHSAAYGDDGGAGGWGGSGGSVTLDAGSDITLNGSIFAHGGNGGAGGTGGNGGTWNRIGNGGNAGGGGDGGSVTMTAGGGIKITGSIATYGGNSRLGAPPGSTGTASGSAGWGSGGGGGGDVSLTANGVHAASGKAISVTGIDTRGGDGYAQSDWGRPGGGGAVTLNSTSTGVNLTGTAIAVGTIDTRGGNNFTGSSSGGWGGSVSITTASGGVTVTSIDTRGGDALASGSSGGRGGTVAISATNGSISVGLIDAGGGNASSGRGGYAGGVYLAAVTSGDISATDIYASGGNGGYAGGSGGVVDLMTDTGNIAVTTIDTHGGNGASYGYNGGMVNLWTGTGNITATTIDTHGGNGALYGYGGGSVSLATTLGGDVSAGNINVAGGVGSSNGMPGYISIDAYGNISLKQVGDLLSTANINASSAVGDIAIDATGNITIDGGSFTAGGVGGSTLISAGANMAVGGISSVQYTYPTWVVGSLGLVAGGQMNLTGNIDIDGSLALAGSSVVANSPITASATQDIAVIAGTLDLAGGAMIKAGYSLGVLAGGAVNLSGGGKLEAGTNLGVAAGAVQLGAGSQLHAGDSAAIAANSVSLDASSIVADVGSASIQAPTNISLQNGAYINAGTDISLGGGALSFTTGSSINTTGGSLSLSGSSVLLDSAQASAANGVLVVAPGSLSLGNSASIYGGANLAVAAGTVQLGAGSQLHAGNSAAITANSVSLDAGSIVASVGWASIQAPTNISLQNSAYIKAGTDISLGGGGALSFATGSSISAIGGGLTLSGSSVLLDSAKASAANTVLVVAPGLLSLGNNASIYGGTDLGVTAGAVTLGAGSQLHAGNSAVIATNSLSLDASSILASTGPATIEVAKDITLENGSYIQAGTEVKLALNGADSLLTLNSMSGQPPSYIWALSPNTIYLDFPLLAGGGVVIDGKETLETLAGASGLFVGPGRTPAAVGAGLIVSYQPTTGGFSSITTDLLRAIVAVSPEAFTVQEGSLNEQDPRRLSGFTAGGKSDEFGDEENQDEKDKDRSADGDKPRQEKGKMRVATCTT
ncbi:MAG: filamentous hemagglutinin N-terminal domain-containing protein [Sulfuritalea sp.]|jgi:filamentous hemagglutinin family protein|nr:filamentous hemagglutinin N-terminal domain-containing protein [Sulfuritalea sp.]